MLIESRMSTKANSECCDERPEGGNVLAPMMFSAALGEALLPSRGLLCSVLGHGFLLLALVCVPRSCWQPGGVHLITAGSMTQVHQVLLLPRLEPMGNRGRTAAASNGKDSANKQGLASSYDSKVIRGVVYRGAQLLVSNPPRPDNFIQSIRQPDLVVKPKLPAPLPLPQMVLIAPAKPLLVPKPLPDILQELPVKVAAVEVIKLPAEEPMVEAPKMPLTVTSADAALHTVAGAASPATLPKLARKNPPAKTNVTRDLLVMNAIRMADHKPSIVPPGELHGAFTVSPSGVAALGSAGGGAESVGAPGMANASGASASQYAGDGGKSSFNASEGKTQRSSAGSGADAALSTTGANGTGIASRAAAQVSRRDNGLGTGSGESPFPSIMIQGGSGGRGGRVAREPAGRASQPQTTYGITIVANGSGGGGFKDFGIFRDEASYTVYLDMEDASSWALQYALDSHHEPKISVPSYSGLLVAPYATSKSLPHFPPDSARRSVAGAIVVFGVISTHGEFEELRIMHSPEPRLDQPLLASLRKWRFRPAEISGMQVAVKVLLGVPLNSIVRD
jgi:hypothetical protein